MRKMSSERATGLQKLSESEDYYSTYSVFSRLSRSKSIFIKWLDGKLPALLADSMGGTAAALDDGTLQVLSVGSGDGLKDSKILTQLWESQGHPRIHAVIVEPHGPYMQQYQELASKESDKLQGIDFDWRQQTFQEYLTTPQGDDKFHFISCVGSIYYLGDLDKCVRILYDRLYDGGLWLMTMAPGESGWGRMYRYLRKKFAGRDVVYCTTADVLDACGKQNIPISEIQIVKTFLDISPCFDPQLSEDGNALLDFMTQTANFAQNAPAELLSDMLQFLRNDCTERGAAGEVILDESIAVVIIRRQ